MSLIQDLLKLVEAEEDLIDIVYMASRTWGKPLTAEYEKTILSEISKRYGKVVSTRMNDDRTEYILTVLPKPGLNALGREIDKGIDQELHKDHICQYGWMILVRKSKHKA